MKIKTFTCVADQERFEKEVNNFLQRFSKDDHQIIDIKYSVVLASSGKLQSALVMYK